MKKARKLVAYFLSLALLITAFSGIGVQNKSNEKIKADASERAYVVLEIVPDVNMATFKYMVELPSAAKGNPVAREYLKSIGLAQGDGSAATSTEYFKTEILTPANPSFWDGSNITVLTKTPDTLTKAEVDSADFIVINETIPSQLSSLVSISKSHFYQNDFSTEMAYYIFAKIAGVEGDPIPYVIDHNIYLNIKGSTANWKNCMTMMPDKITQSRNDLYFGYVGADEVADLGESGSAAEASPISHTNQDEQYGSKLNSYKLYKLLSCINPATVYGLFFTKTDGSYGIDKDLNYISLGISSDTARPYVYSLGTKYNWWSDKIFAPWYMGTGGSISSVTTPEGKMGWIEAASRPSGNFAAVIGSSATKGNGIVYKSSSLFEAFGLSSGGSGGSSSVDLSTYTDVTTDEKVTIDIPEDNNYYSNDNKFFKVTNGTDGDLTNWKISFKLDGVSNISPYSTPADSGFVISGNVVTYYSKQKLSKGSTLSLQGNITASRPFNYSKYTVSSSGNDAIGIDIADIIKSFNATKNDYHPYRYLVSYGNSVHSTLNRSLVADMVAVANETGKGLVGGVVIENVSAARMENIFDQNRDYDAIITGGSADDLVNKFRDQLNSSAYFGVMYRETPIEYYTETVPDYNGFHAILSEDSYSGNAEIAVEGDANFINYKVPKRNADGTVEKDSYGKIVYDTETDENGVPKGKRAASTLNFDFDIIGDSDYYARVYIDADHDDIFEDAFYEGNEYTFADRNSSVYKTQELYSEVLKLEKDSTTGKYKPLNIVGKNTILGENFTGGFAWKLVITDTKSPYRSITKLGFSAIKNTATEKKVINILQIVPTDYNGKYGNDDSEMPANPVLLLPTRNEIKTAKENNNNKSIGEYDISDKSSGVNGLGFKGILHYFDDVLTTDKCGVQSDSEVAKTGTVTYSYDGDTPNKKSKTPVIIAGLIQFLIEKLGDYELNVYRYSVYEFNQQMYKQAGKTAYVNSNLSPITYNAATGKFTVKDKTGATSFKYNSDGTQRYVYDANELGLESNWSSLEITTGSRVAKVYLIDSVSGKIYGKRQYVKDSDGKDTDEVEAIYYGKTEKNKKTNVLVNGIAVKDENVEIDLLVLGFGSNMDYFGKEGLDAIEGYLDNNGPAFIGYGAVVKNAANNNLGPRIKSIIGMSNNFTGESGWNKNNSDNGTNMVINDTLFSHYPYTVQHYFIGTKIMKQQYKLDLVGNSDIVVSYAKYTQTKGNGYGNWGDGAENYYLYKKGAITFCGWGSAFLEPEISGSSVTGIMSTPEAMMFVNALVTSARSGSGGIADDPYFRCIDPDSSSLGAVQKEDDEIGDDSFVGKYVGTDAVYTDYDYVAVAKAKVGEENAILPIESESVKPAGYLGTTSNERWVPYQVRTTAADGYLRIKEVGLDVYLYAPEPLAEKNEDGTIKHDAKGNIVYQFNENGAPKYNKTEDGKRDIYPKDEKGNIIYAYIKMTGKVTNKKVTVDGVEKNVLDYIEYPVSKKNKYYIVVPLSPNDSKYTNTQVDNYVKDKMGFVFSETNPRDRFDIILSLVVNGGEVEKHTLSMIRRVLYLVK